MEKSKTTFLSYCKDITNGDLVFSGRISRKDVLRLDAGTLAKISLTNPQKKYSDAAKNIFLIFSSLENQHE